MTEDRIITGDMFLDWLAERIPLPKETRRVIIDAEIGHPLHIYVDRFGTEALIKGPIPDMLMNAGLLTIEVPHD